MIPTNQMFNFTVEDRGGHQVLFTRDHVKYNKFGQITSFYDVKEYLITPKLLQELKEKKEKELIAKKERKDYRLKSLKCISKSTDDELAITSEDPKRIFSYRKCYSKKSH